MVPPSHLKDNLPKVVHPQLYPWFVDTTVKVGVTEEATPPPRFKRDREEESQTMLGLCYKPGRVAGQSLDSSKKTKEKFFKFPSQTCCFPHYQPLC